MRALLLSALLLAVACDRTAWSTTVADTAPVRMAMLSSVEVGRTTETEFTTRWGNPTQKIREGAQVDYIYRDMRDPGSRHPIRFGASTRWVAVTFRYGTAVAARSSDTETCRATFPPRPPGPGFFNPTVIKPVGDCALWARLAGAADGTTSPDGGSPGRPGVPLDAYHPDGRGK